MSLPLPMITKTILKSLAVKLGHMGSQTFADVSRVEVDGKVDTGVGFCAGPGAGAGIAFCAGASL